MSFHKKLFKDLQGIVGCASAIQDLCDVMSYVGGLKYQFGIIECAKKAFKNETSY